jgi:hypothetical protein
MWNGEFRSGQLPRIAAGVYLQLLIAEHSPKISVCWEKYLVLPASNIKQDGSATKMIGVLEHIRAEAPYSLIKPKSSSARKVGLGTLQVVGWYRRGLVHGNDAAAHVLSYLLTYDLLPSDLKQLIIDRLEADFG